MAGVAPRRPVNQLDQLAAWFDSSWTEVHAMGLFLVVMLVWGASDLWRRRQ